MKGECAMNFEMQMIELLNKKGDISKEITNLIYAFGFDERKITLSTYVLYKICERLTNEEQEKVWDSLLSVLDVDSITDEIIEYLVKNKISILTLCHLELSNKWLIKLLDYDDAPIYTISKRYYLSSEYSFSQFVEFYCSHLCKYNYVALYLLDFYDASPKRELLKFLCFSASEPFASSIRTHNLILS